jgi:polysaccharide deacetylase family protein (PEP-CTERM system associated)
MPPDSGGVGPLVTFTLDLEDHRPGPTTAVRYPELTRRWLDWLDERGIRGTFFVVGDVARWSPDLVLEVADRGHEIGLHNWKHVQIFRLERARFRQWARDGKDLLEQLTGQEVKGFRCPTGSLLPSTQWCTEILADEGFVYSSSVLPAKSYPGGFPGCPHVPFRWPSGLIELPCPTLTVGTGGVPFIGGVFLRVLPTAVGRHYRRRLNPEEMPWVYIHPYDIDTDEPVYFVPDTPKWGPLFLWANRSKTLDRLDQLFAGGAGPPLGERLDALRGQLPMFLPVETVVAAG